MPLITIYNGRRLLNARQFKKSFYIAYTLKNDGLLWSIDGEEIWETDREDVPKEQLSIPRTPIVWIVSSPVGFPKSYRLKSLLPEWNMQINGTKCERGFYESIEFVWSEVDLIYGDYKFQIIFSVDERNPQFGNDETKPPAPMIPIK